MDQPTTDGAKETAPEVRRKTGKIISMKRLKFETGLAVLFVAMGAMIAMALLDVFISVRNMTEGALVSNAFEAFKLIAVTVLGYIFGTTHASDRSDD